MGKERKQAAAPLPQSLRLHSHTPPLGVHGEAVSTNRDQHAHALLGPRGDHRTLKSRPREARRKEHVKSDHIHYCVNPREASEHSERSRLNTYSFTEADVRHREHGSNKVTGDQVRGMISPNTYLAENNIYLFWFSADKNT